MRKIVALTAFIFALFASATAAEAATCFWVGGTGTWSTLNLTSWASTTNGTPGTCAATGGVPKQAGDVATFDANSGGGTVTPNFNMSIATITMSAFTGTLDFSANNNSPTFSSQLNNSGTATNTLNCGTGTWTFTTLGGGMWNGTNVNATYSCPLATFIVQPASAPTSTISLTPKASFSVGAFSLVWPNTPSYGFQFALSTGATVASLSTSGAIGVLSVAHGTTLTVTGAITVTGTLPYPIVVEQDLANTNQSTITAGSAALTYVALYNTKFTNAATATNSFNLGGNTNVTITPPSAGVGSGFMILHP